MRPAFAGMAAMCVALAMSFASAREPDARNIDVDAEIVVGQDGSVRNIDVDESVAPGVAALVKKAVMQWRFEPIVRDGKPIMAKTGMSLDLAATKAGAGYMLRIERVLFVTSRSKPVQFVLPQMPRSAMSSGTAFDVLAAMRVDAQGNVVDAALLSLVLHGGNNHPPKHLREDMASEMVRALKRSKFKPADVAAGERGDDTFYLPLDYRIGRGRGQALSIGERFRDATPVPWLTPEQQPKLIDMPESKGGLPVAMAERDVRLSTKVVGATL